MRSANPRARSDVVNNQRHIPGGVLCQWPPDASGKISGGKNDAGPGGWRRLWQTGIRLWREAGRIGGLDQIAGEGFHLVMVSATTVVGLCIYILGRTGRPVVVTGAASTSVHSAAGNRRKLVGIMRRYDPCYGSTPAAAFAKPRWIGVQIVTPGLTPPTANCLNCWSNPTCLVAVAVPEVFGRRFSRPESPGGINFDLQGGWDKRIRVTGAGRDSGFRPFSKKSDPDPADNDFV
jgi:hypothetical protein